MKREKGQGRPVDMVFLPAMSGMSVNENAVTARGCWYMHNGHYNMHSEFGRGEDAFSAPGQISSQQPSSL